MNINEYKNTLDTIKIRHYSVDELERYADKKRHRRKQSVITLVILAVLLVCAIPVFFSMKKDITLITVYADNGEKMILSEEKSKCQIEAFPSSLQYSEDSDTGLLNVELFFVVVGKDIDEITLSCAEDEIRRKDIGEVSSFFVKTIKMNTSEYNEIYRDFEESDTFLYSLRAAESNEVSITSLVGNIYSVKYNEQSNSDQTYGLMINALKNGDDNFSIDNVVLNVQIRYSDASIESKKIKISASENAFYDIEIEMI